MVIIRHMNSKKMVELIVFFAGSMRSSTAKSQSKTNDDKKSARNFWNFQGDGLNCCFHSSHLL